MQYHLAAPWDDVRVFLAAHRDKSLGAAARRLGVDTSTVSRRLAAFESALGVRLFERTREGLLATRAAERVLAAAEAMEAAHGRMSRDASDVEARAEGVVRISVAPGMADAFLAPALIRLRGAHPLIDIELDASMRPVDLTKYEADIALRSVALQGAELVATKIATAQWFVGGAPKLVRKLGAMRAWTDAPWIAWDRDLASFGPARWLSHHVPRARIALRTSHFGAQLVAARTGLGLMLVPPQYATLYKLAPARFVPALAASAAAGPVDDLWLVGHRVSRDVPRVAAVWKFLVNEFRAGRKLSA